VGAAIYPCPARRARQRLPSPGGLDSAPLRPEGQRLEFTDDTRRLLGAGKIKFELDLPRGDPGTDSEAAIGRDLESGAPGAC